MIKLSCRSCGAKLELTADIDHFSCLHCGTEWIVNRSGGIVSLKGVEDGINELVREVKAAKTYDGILHEEKLRDKAKAELEREKKEADSALHGAVLEGDIDRIRRLIDKGANVNVKNEDSETPLHSAAIGGHTATAELLIQKGANVNAKNEHGDTPLHCATRWGHTATAEFLIQKGANVNVKSNRGFTPLDKEMLVEREAEIEYLKKILKESI